MAAIDVEVDAQGGCLGHNQCPFALEDVCEGRVTEAEIR